MQNRKESGERSFQDEAGFPCGHMPPPHRDALKRRFLPRMNDGGLRATSDE